MKPKRETRKKKETFRDWPIKRHQVATLLVGVSNHQKLTNSKVSSTVTRHWRSNSGEENFAVLIGWTAL